MKSLMILLEFGINNVVIPSRTPLVTPSMMACVTHNGSHTMMMRMTSTCHNTPAAAAAVTLKMYSHAAMSRAVGAETFCACSLVPTLRPSLAFPEVKFNTEPQLQIPKPRAPVSVAISLSCRIYISQQSRQRRFSLHRWLAF